MAHPPPAADPAPSCSATKCSPGVGTFVWLVTFHVPYPILLAIAVAILDLIPVVGSTIGGILVSLIALTVSLPVAIATLAFYVAYRLAEDYLIVPKIIGRTVQVTAQTRPKLTGHHPVRGAALAAAPAFPVSPSAG